MSLNDPDIQTSEKFSDVLEENVPFVLRGIRVIEGVQTSEFGEGTMVILDVTLDDNEEKSLGIWGQYLVEQARSADDSDFGKVYVITREVVEDYSSREVKMLKPADQTDIPF